MRVLIDGVRHHKCDWCRKDFTVEGEEHITIQVGERSGLASNVGPLPGWRLRRILKPTQLHFCLPPKFVADEPSCLEQWQRVVFRHEPPLTEYLI